MVSTRTLEIHVAHACNLRCESCSHYSNHGHKGLLAPEEADRWMGGWSARLSMEKFVLLGGEPTANPRLAEFFPIARRHWPKARLRLVTNGFFLHRHPDLPRVLQTDPNVEIHFSVHHGSQEYLREIEDNAALLRDWGRRYGVPYKIFPSMKYWTRRYRGHGAQMEPYTDGKPRESWENCAARHAAQLLDGCIWKCPPLAYLPMQDRKFGLSAAWAPYLKYRPLEPGCSDAEMAAFFQREEESHCGMCSARPENFRLPIPLVRKQARAA